MPHQVTVYDDDLAYIHDVGFSGLSESWAPGLLELFHEAGIEQGTIVDLGCGGGGWIARLVEAGFNAIGVDVSAAMIERSRQRVPSAEFHVDSVWNYEIPPCRAITALSEVVCYRSHDSDSADLEVLAGNVFTALQPDGLFIMDVVEVGLDRNKDRTFVEGDDWACLVRFEYDQLRARLNRHITTFRKVDALFRRSHERHIMQLYDGDAVAEMLKRCGFRVRQVREFGSAALLPSRLGFVARKPD